MTSSIFPVNDINNQGTLQNKLDELTEAGEFDKVVNLLNTPDKLVNYESRHFEHYLDKYFERSVRGVW